MIASEYHVLSSSQFLENVEPSTAEAEVRILLVGDSNVGKTSLIDVLLYDRFSDNVPARSGTIQFPREFSEDGVLTQITDYSGRVQSVEELRAMIKEANAICVVYSVEDISSEERVTSYWLPLIQEALGGNNHNCSVLLVANKSDNQNGSDHITKMAPIMNDYLEIETVVECSAKITKNVSEIFYYAQKAVIYPFRPLFSAEKRELSMKCQKAITRIFKLCDANNDGLLSDDELKKYQMVSFGVPLTSAAIEDVKKLISEYDGDMIMDNAITLEGFRYLHQMFIQKGRHDTVWTVLKRFGYDLNLQLRQDYLLPRILIPKGSSVEPSTECIHFIQTLFMKHDEDCDGCLSNTELRSLFSVCPTNPWTDEMLNSVEQNRDGWITNNGYINLWTRNFLLDLSQTMGHLAYLGFNVEYGSQLEAVTITQDRKKDIEEKSTKRRVFKCHVIGPRNAGKTVFCRSFIGKTPEDVARLSKKQLDPYVINSVLVKSEIKHLLTQEIDLDSRDDKLSMLEKSAADVICLLYDSTDSNSFAYCAELYLRNFRRLKLPCLFVATKYDKYEVEQFYEEQPAEFCRNYQLPKPYYFSEKDIGNQSSEVFSILATMAAYPHLKSLFYVRDTSNLFSIVTSTALVAVLVGFFVLKAVRG